MKLGIHLSTFTKSWSEDITPYIKRAKEIGYDGVEIPLMEIENINVNKIRGELEKYSMESVCGTGLTLNADISSEDVVIQKAGIAHLKKCIDICHLLGNKQLGGVLYAPWGIKISRAKAKNNMRNSVEALKIAADYADKKGVTLCLELLNRYESYFMNTVEEGMEIIDMIGRDNVGLLFDTFHAHIEEKNIYEALKLGGNKIKYIHFCENTRGIPLTGQVNWKDVCLGLKEIKYDGWITLENFVNCDCEVGIGTSIWRQVEKDSDYAALYGYKNILNILREV